MERKTIYAPSGAKYLKGKKDEPKFMEELPVNCLFNKGATGVGGTTIAIEDNKNTIIAMPYRPLIKNKVKQYPEILLGVHGDTDNKGNRLVSDVDIIRYIQDHEVKKIAVTYDSLGRLVKLLSIQGIDVLTDYFLLVDEWHVLFNSYVFRYGAIRDLLKLSRQFKKVTYMTATPIEDEFILEELKDLPIVEVQWPNVTKVDTVLIHTQQPEKTVISYVKDKIAGKEYANLHFFVNSVDFIRNVIIKTGLKPEEVKIVCSKNKNLGKGKKSNQAKLGDNYPIAEALDSAKIINFYTSTCFEGCDVKDENGKTIIVSDRNKSHTLMDISTLSIQICGRIRDSRYYSKIYHIFSETRYTGSTTLEEYIQSTRQILEKGESWVKELNQGSPQFRNTTMEILRKAREGLNEMYIYENNGQYEIDKNLLNLDIVNFKITKRLYSSYSILADEYITNGFTVESGIQMIHKVEKNTDKLAKNPDAKISFRELFETYVQLKDELPLYFIGNQDERIYQIEQVNPLIPEAYKKLGRKRVKELKYHVTNIKIALLKVSDASTDHKITKLVQKRMPEGVVKTTQEVREILKAVYADLELKRTAKATDLIEWFDTDKKSTKINGKTTDHHWIIRTKIIQVK